MKRAIACEQKRARRPNHGVVVSGTYLNCTAEKTAELEQNVGTFLAFLWNSNWYKCYVSEGPGVEFKVRLSSLREYRAELA